MGNANGKIFAPVSMTDIATVIGDTTDLARSENVNTWAKYQPFETNGNPYKQQTEIDRRDAAWGFHFDSSDPNAPCGRSATELINKIINEDVDWARKDISVSRMGDFINYNHYAINPYSQNFLSGNIDHIKRVLLIQSSSPNAEMLLNDMPEVDGVPMNDYAIACIYREANSPASERAIAPDNLYGLTEHFSTEVSFKVPLTTKYDTRYFEYIFAATNAEESGMNISKWIYFPNTRGEFVMNGYYDMALKDDGDIPMFEATNINGFKLTESTQQIKTLTLCFECLYNLDFTPRGKYILHAWNRKNGWDRGQDYEFDLHIDGQFKGIEAMNIQSAVSGAAATDAMIAMAIYVNDPDDAASGMMNYTPYYFDFENNRIRLGVPTAEQGISIWRMKEIYG